MPGPKRLVILVFAVARVLAEVDPQAILVLDDTNRGMFLIPEKGANITGWTQVNGRCAVNWEQKFQCDIWSVDNNFFCLDSKVLVLNLRKFSYKKVSELLAMQQCKIFGRQIVKEVRHLEGRWTCQAGSRYRSALRLEKL